MDARMTEEEPHDRLTRICDEMTKVFDSHPEHKEDDKCIVFLDGDGWGGLVLHGYDDAGEALVRIFSHMRAIFNANGSDLKIIKVGQG